MKTLPIRCRPGDARPIRAIAYEAVVEPGKNEPLPRDSCPTLKFMEDARSIPKGWADLLAVLDESARNGPPQNDEKFGFLDDGLWEFKSWKLRIACFFDENMIICTHGFIKKQQKTPKGEVSTAKRHRNAYQEAKKRKKLSHAEPAAPPSRSG